MRFACDLHGKYRDMFAFFELNVEISNTLDNFNQTSATSTYHLEPHNNKTLVFAYYVTRNTGVTFRNASKPRFQHFSQESIMFTGMFFFYHSALTVRLIAIKCILEQHHLCFSKCILHVNLSRYW